MPKRVVLALAISIATATSSEGQTFVQLTDLGANIGPRLTRSVSLARVDRALFSHIGTKVTFIEGANAYEFATDFGWGRVLVGLKDQYVHEFTNRGGAGGAMVRPTGIDISARRNVYIADRGVRKLFIGTFVPSAQNLMSPRTVANVGRPVDVAWDGRFAPMTTDYLYVLDDVAGTVSYWDFNGATPTAPLWTYGATGTGTGQFRRPTGICVGKQPAGNGTLFNTYFYVVDRGNKRVVLLERTAQGAVWHKVYAYADWTPVDCAVDHFGQVYVVDQTGHRLFKFSWFLDFIQLYGSYGTGPSNLNTFAYPRAVSVPCGLRSSPGGTVWYCEGRVITAEKWSDQTGAMEHYMGIEAAITSQPPPTVEGSATVFVRTTEVSTVYAIVTRLGVGTVRTLVPSQLYSSGEWGLLWDGLDNAGHPVPDANYQITLYFDSPYGCPGGFSQTWCHRWVATNQFAYHYCVPGGGGGGPQLRAAITGYDGPRMNTEQQPPPCGGGGGGPQVRIGDGIPTTFAVRQVPGRTQSAPVGLSRLTESSAITPALTLTGDPVPTTAQARSDVREFGVMTLQLNLPSASAVQIMITDLRGRRILEETLEAAQGGVYLYRWTGRASDGSTPPPGVYLARIGAAGKTETKKLILTGPGL